MLSFRKYDDIFIVLAICLAGCSPDQPVRSNALASADFRSPEPECTFSKEAPKGWLSRDDVRCAANPNGPIYRIMTNSSKGYPIVSKFPPVLQQSFVSVLSVARYRVPKKQEFKRLGLGANDLQVHVVSNRIRNFPVNFDSIKDELGPEVAKWFKDNMPELRRLATAGQPSEAKLKQKRPNDFGQNFAKKLLTKNVTEITLTSHPDPNIKSVENVPIVRRLRDAKAIRAMLVAMSRSSQSFEAQDLKNAPDRPQELSFIYKEGTENIVDSICWWRSDSHASSEAFAKLFSEHFESSNR